MGKFVDLTGQIFGRLTVIKRAENSKHKDTRWECKCSCSNKEVTVNYGSLKNGDSTSCGCFASERTKERNTIDLTGQIFGRLTVIKRVENSKQGNTKYKCICSCSNKEIVVYSGSLKNGHTRSCGCFAKERKKESKTIPLEQIQQKLEIKGIRLIEGTYKNVRSKAVFELINNPELGTWSTSVGNVTRDISSGHPKQKSQKIKDTCMAKYGVESANQVASISLSQARAARKITDLIHWKTGEMVSCQGSYEVAFCNYLNENRLDYESQIVFPSFDDKTYRIDFFVKDWGMYVEIKGFFRKDTLSKQKWEYFHSTHLHNSVILFKKDLLTLNIKVK